MLICFRHSLPVMLIALLAFHLPLRPWDAHKRFASFADETARKPTALIVGMSECARCHREPNKDEPAPLLCRCNEVAIWEKHDRHRIAHAVLQNERSLQIAKVLGISDPAKDAQCVSCHGVVITDEKLRHRSFSPERALQEGITCVVCHGGYKDWIDLHGGIDRETWRTYPRKRKEVEFGMTDLWDPVRRAQICLSCHLGDPAQARMVTHAMYAAGHPPLSAFELTAYSDAMPRHWQYLAEKPESIRALLGVDDNQARYERTRLSILGGIVALRQSQRLLLHATLNERRRAWPDFAAFECYSCHRPLRSDSWKTYSPQLQLSAGRPGPRAWPAQILLLQPILDPGVGSDHIHHVLGPMYRSFDLRPFGDPITLEKTLAKNLASLDSFQAKASSATFDQNLLRHLLLTMSDPNQVTFLDFNSARYHAWLVRALYSDISRDVPPDAQVDRLFASLRTRLQLDLEPNNAEPLRPSESNARLSKLATAALEYDPQRHREDLTALHRALQKALNP